VWPIHRAGARLRTNLSHLSLPDHRTQNARMLRAQVFLLYGEAAAQLVPSRHPGKTDGPWSFRMRGGVDLPSRGLGIGTWRHDRRE